VSDLGSLVSVSDISLIIVFLEGILSFFSPCVIPLIPIYMAYLAGNTNILGHNGAFAYNRKKALLHTAFFVLGISFAFFLLGMAFTAIGSFFNSNQALFTRIAGLLIILLGLFQVGFFNSPFLNKERRLPFDLTKYRINPFVAFILGFTFSFAWTPCVGPALSSVLLLASTAKSAVIGNLLILLYTLGFIIPFLALGLFTTQVLNFFRKQQKLLKYTVKTGGLVLIFLGVMTFTGWMNGISSYLNSFGLPAVPTDTSLQQEIAGNPSSTGEVDQNQAGDEEPGSTREDAGSVVIPAFDFTLIDQYGKKHTLSDYKGKVVFLNFWGTWCPPCRLEMPNIQAVYEEYGQNQNDVIILGVALPKTSANPNTREQDKEGIIAFLEENKYTFPVVFDETGEVVRDYYVSAWPTTFLIDKNGNIYGYIPGMMTADMMRSAIEQTLAATE